MGTEKPVVCDMAHCGARAIASGQLRDRVPLTELGRATCVECFRIDESGYTGFDLLNADQRFQGAAAIAIDYDDATRLIREHFPTLQATELKYGALARRPLNHPRLVALLKEVLQNYKSVVYVCDKQFLLALMFLEYAAEPFYHARNINFYENGQNFVLGSILLRAGPQLLGEPAFEKLLPAFQHAMKVKTQASLDELVAVARATQWQKLPEALGPIVHAAPECLHTIATPGITTDAAMVVLHALITRMEVMCDGPYRVEHDQSKNLTKYSELLQKLITHDKVAEFRSSKIATLRFPLKLREVTQVDSKSSPAVQLADLLVGATLDAASSFIRPKPKGLTPNHLAPLFAEDQLIYLCPSLDVEEQRLFHAGSQASEMIDYFGINFGSGA